MKTRVITGAVLVAIAVPVLIFSKYIVYPLLISVLSFFAMLELISCLGLRDKYFIAAPAYVFSAAMPTVVYLLGWENFGTSLKIYALSLFLILFFYFGTAVAARGELKFPAVSEVFALTAYVSAGFSAMSLVRYVPNGAYYIALVFFASWICDTFAYLFGSKFGKHRLIPEISPKKSVEGAIAGVVFSVLFFLLYGLVIDLVKDGITVNYLSLALSGLLLSVISQFGDLIASLIKRERGIKDYGKIFPGHGGVMDRFDSILAVSLPLFVIAVSFPPFS